MKEDKKCYCDLFSALTPERTLADGLEEDRQRLILYLDQKWVNGTTITYFLFQQGPWKGSDRQMNLIRQAFDQWKDIGIGLYFQEVNDIKDSMVCIGFQKGDGSWSYVGRYVLQIDSGKRTMNIGWDNSQTLDTCIHEIGHTLGFPHEHQNPTGGIVWDEEAVYKSLGGPPNYWSRETTYHNIIRKISPDEIQSSTWDKDSIMHYPFEAGLIKVPTIYQTRPLDPQAGLSPIDKRRVLKFYPPMDEIKVENLELGKPLPILLNNGEQERFTIQLDRELVVDIFTTGQADTFLVLFDHQADGSFKELVTDDDSGESRNASLGYKLQSGTEYALQVRLYWQEKSRSDGDPTVLPKLHMTERQPGGGGGGKCCRNCHIL